MIKFKLSWTLIVALALLGVAAGLLLTGASAASARPTTVPFQRGDVFVGVGGGKITHRDTNGVLLETLNTTSGSQQDTGVCFDAAGNLYTTNFDASTVSKFDNHGNLLLPSWGSGFAQPESCVVDIAQHVWVGNAGSTQLTEYDTAGTLLHSYTLAIEHHGVDWIDLAADQCTMYYTSEGQLIKRFNVCTATQLPDFASGLAARCFALRIRSNGEVMVTCESQAYRLDATGATIQTYPTTRYGESSFFFAANLDPDGTSFWTAGFFTGNVYKIDIATGNRLLLFTDPPQGGYGTAGLGLYGELLASQPTATPTAPPTHTPPATPASSVTPQPTGTPAPTNTPLPTATPCTIHFGDVQPSDYFYNPVRYLVCHGAISGYADNTFRPYNNTTRGQLAKIVVGAEGWPLNTAGGPHFSDVPVGSPFYPFVETAYNRGVISGYADGTFRPGANVTRAQLSKIVVGAQGWAIQNPPTAHFSDVPAGSPFYSVIETAYAHGIISGYADGTFRPGANATRGQIAKIVYLAVTGP